MFLAQGEFDWLVHIGDNGVATALIIGLVVIAVAWLLVTRSHNAVRLRGLAIQERQAERTHQLAREAQQERLAIEAETAREHMKLERQRVQAESDQAAALSQLRITLDTTGVALDRVATLIATSPTRQDLQEHFERVDSVLERLQANVKTVPAETVRLLDPQAMIENLRAALMDGMAQIETGLAQRLEALGAEISPAMRTMMNDALGQYQRAVQHQFDNVETLLAELRIDLAKREGTEAGVADETPEAEQTAADESSRR